MTRVRFATVVRAWSAPIGCLVLVVWASTGRQVCAQSAGDTSPPSCGVEVELTRAAAELLLTGSLRPTALQLSAAVRQAGSDAVGLHALFVPAGASTRAQTQWLEGLRLRVDGELTCGHADSEAGRLWIALGRGGALDAVPGHERALRGSLRQGFHDAELVFAAADGALVRVGVGAEALARGIALPESLALPATAQLVAWGPGGPRPVAERVIAAGARSEPSAAALPSADAAEPASLGALVLSLRAQRGRAALRDNRLLREAATVHARDVCAGGRVAHELTQGAGPASRLARAGLSARVLGETITRASDSRAALAALQNSPSHLYTLLDRRFTDFGVGVAEDRSHKHCYVVMLCAWPRYIGKQAHR